MTDLQLGLIGLGATAVIVVVAYNKWQEYRHRKLAEQVLNVQHTDVLLDQQVAESPSFAPPEIAQTDSSGNADAAEPQFIAQSSVSPLATGERIEPVLRIDPADPEAAAWAEETEHDLPAAVDPALPDVEAATLTPPEPRRAVRAEVPAPAVAAAPVLSAKPAHEEAVAAVESRAIPEPLHLLSPQVDYVAAFEAVEPAPAYQILEAQRGVLARIRKPMHWIGFNEHAREWDVIVDDGASAYRRIRIGLQLVDRQGPLRDGDLSVFHLAMQDLADELMAIADLPPRQQALDTAVQLDEFCASVDIQIGINVISQGQVFPGTKLRALAEAAGMTIDGEGRFVRCDDEGNVLYMLLNQEAAGFSSEAMKTMTTHAITFLLDVPRVAHGERVFNQMVDLARRFADVLHGSLVDDNRRPLSEAALEPIRRQVGQYQATLAAHGLPAGGPLTRRLFS